ncbi:MAG: S9 family peptidase [Gemmatimonadales bacterium]|nr:MAG: S9 family peptidase [Gemmatimonadales bacterium]
MPVSQPPSPLRAPIRRRSGAWPSFLVILTALVLGPGTAHGQAFDLADFFRYSTASVEALRPDGSLMLLSLTAMEDRLGIDNYRFGDPTYTAPVQSRVLLVDVVSGEEHRLFPGPVQLQRAVWSPQGDRLAVLVREPAASEGPEPPFQIRVFDLSGGTVAPIPHHRVVGLPAHRVLTGDTQLRWTADGSRLLFDARTREWKEAARERFLEEVHGPIVVRSSEDPFLSWEEVRRQGLERGILAWDPEAEAGHQGGTSGGDAVIVRDHEAIGSWQPLPDGRLRVHVDITEETDYDRILGRDDRVQVETLDGAEPRVIIPNDRGLSARWSGDGTAWTWSTDGELRFQSVEMDEARVLAGDANEGDDESDPTPRFSPERLSWDGSLLLATTDDGYWIFRTDSGDRTRILELDPDDDDAPRWSVAAWDHSARDLYLLEAARSEWLWALHRVDPTSGERTELMRGDRRVAGLEISEDGETLVFTTIGTDGLPRLMASNRNLQTPRTLGPDPNPWLAERALGEVELMRYLDADGEELFGIVHLPPGFRDDGPYPTVFILYESFFNPSFNTQARLLNAHGYVVVQPSVNLVQGQPGEGWLKGVTAAANQLIERGITDPDRMGIQGVSYGGYAVNLLVAQTPRFAAAINISGKTNMVSFYTDSPRLGTRNTHAPERSQDRIGGTLWEMPQRYLDHSAVMVADRIRTPLLLLTGQQDHNVTERTTSEMFYALRRLGRTVEWVSYIDGGHGMPRSTRAEAEDYLTRILDWYERHMPEPDPAIPTD